MCVYRNQKPLKDFWFNQNLIYPTMYCRYLIAVFYNTIRSLEWITHVRIPKLRTQLIIIVS